MFKSTLSFLPLGIAVALAGCSAGNGSDSNNSPFNAAGTGGDSFATGGTGGSSSNAGGSGGAGPGGGSGGSRTGNGGSSVGGGGATGGGGAGVSGGMGGTSPTDDGGTTSGDGSGGTSGVGGGGGGTFPSVSDFTAAGPFMTTTADVTSVSCTIFRPATLGDGGLLHPVIIWGNGTFNTPSNYSAMFTHFASHGFIVAAADTSNAGSGAEMLTCLKYVLDQNMASGSPFEGHVDTNHIASSGYSQGGAGCLEAGIDPRFTVLAAVSPFIALSLGGYDTTSVGKQVHPLFMISGDADTVAVPSSNQAPIFMQAMVPIFWATHAGSSHLEVLNAGGGAYAGPLTAWFRYKLMNDPDAAKWFEKPDCTLCSASGWTVQTNSLWQ